MSSRYTFKHIENILESDAASQCITSGKPYYNSDYGLEFTAIAANPHPPQNAGALIPFEGSNEIRQSYLDNVQTPGFLVSGVLRFDEFNFFENCALPLDVKRREGIIGEPVCWGIDFANWYASQHNLGLALDRANSTKYIDTIVNEIRTPTIRGEAAVLSAPGQEIYGHWLLDVIPRLHILDLAGDTALPIYYNNLPRWGAYFLRALDIDPTRVLPHPSRRFKIERAIVPTSSKSGYRLGADTLKASWSRVMLGYEQPAEDGGSIGEKIYFSRRRLANNPRRSFVNIDEIEAYFVRRGYTIVYPEILTIPQQIKLMTEARIVVGEDGSALHNIIFASPGLTVGVLTLPERNNLWHLGICQILNHQIAYCNMPEAGEVMSLDILRRFLDTLE